MKKKWLKILCPILVLVIVAGAVCIGLYGASKPRFRVGYGIISIQPDSSFTDSDGKGLALAGYGNTDKRRGDYAKSAEYDYDELMATCIAMEDESGQQVLMFTLDLIRITDTLTANVRTAIRGTYNIPEENILLNASHTHSAPDYNNGDAISDEYQAFVVQQLGKLATAALEDLTELTDMRYGSVEVEQTAVDGTVQRMNFTRHYMGEYKNEATGQTEIHEVGDNFAPLGVTSGELTFVKYTGHTLDADPTMYVVLFERRDGKQPVVMTNFRAHPHTQGGSGETRITADTVGAFRYLMAREGYLLSHFQGAAGMTNSTSYIPGEMILYKYKSVESRRARKAGDTKWLDGEADPYLIQYGKLMVSFAKDCLENNMQSASPRKLSVTRYIYEGTTNKSMVDKYAQARQVQDMWTNPQSYYSLLPDLKDAGSGDVKKIVQAYAAQSFGIRSVYQANAIVAQYNSGDTRTLDLYTLALDDTLCIGMAPCELFHQNSMDFEESAVSSGKFKMAMTFGYSNDAEGYMPSAEVWEYTSYETDVTHYTQGTAEKIIDFFCDMLDIR